MAARRYTPAKGGRAGIGRMFRRMLSLGFEERRGTLALERVEMDSLDFLPPDLVGLGTVNVWYLVRFAEDPETLQGHVHASRTLNRVKNGERVAISVDPVDGFIRKIWPLDRKLRWYQR